MHELSIVQDLLKVCDTNATEQGATAVKRVEIQIGKLSGVEPHYLKKAFDAFKVGGHCSDAELIIEIQDIIVRCCQCGREGTIMANEFVCPMCGSRELVVIKGEDLILMRLELEK